MTPDHQIESARLALADLKSQYEYYAKYGYHSHAERFGWWYHSLVKYLPKEITDEKPAQDSRPASDGV